MSFTMEAARVLVEAVNLTANDTMVSVGPRICREGGKGTFLPLFANEHTWPAALRGILYCLGLGWSFMGVAIIADIFMVAIEEITSQKKAVVIKGNNFYVKTWNDTVANLTLMALGSSAPEILLACIETLSGEFFAGDLGPSTIVGSAAFNLLVISAVCIIGIPKGEIRRINDMNVFAVTCTFSIFAYLWLLIVLMVWTPNIVTLEEAILTFLMFPLVVILAYMADQGYFSKRSKGEGLGGTVAEVKDVQVGPQSEFPPDLVAKTLKEVRAEYGDKINDVAANKLVIFRLLGQKKKSRAEYRIEATRKMSMGKIPVKARLDTDGLHEDIVQNELNRATKLGIKVGRSSVVPSEDESKMEEGLRPIVQEAESGDAEHGSIIQFSAPMHGFLENAGTIKVAVQRIGVPDQTVKVHYETRDGTASSGEDYITANGKLRSMNFNNDHMVMLTLCANIFSLSFLCVLFLFLG
jgi:solute carrier family 8 (sodium/calcium exchanger)